MKKYLQQLLADIEHSIEMAKSSLPELDWLPEYNEEEDEASINASKAVKMEEICGLPTIAFPPENLLTEVQIIVLLDAMQRLWSNWRVWWELPHALTERQQYSAMLRAYGSELVIWTATSGGTVKICQFEAGTYCPFGASGGYCYCKEIDDAAKHDVALWEEHVRSQGLDPYREMTAEEGAAFEEEMRLRNQRKNAGEDNWSRYPPFEKYFHESPDEESPLHLENTGDEWLEHIFWEKENDEYGLEPDGSGLDDPEEFGEEDDDFDLPLF